MRPICSVQAVRHAEAAASVPEPVLMQRAATAVSVVCADLLRGSRGALRGAQVVALVGSGNNGGDALWALARLAARGVRATAVGTPERMHPEGLAACRAAGVTVTSWSSPAAATAVASAELVIDGIVGIGGSGGLHGPAADLVERITAPVVAVDVPSGVDSDTGQVIGLAVRADVTVCFGVLKKGLVVQPGREHAGTVTVVDIGLPEDVTAGAHALDLADLANPEPRVDSHKYRRGVVGVRAGCDRYPGAALLAVLGARAAGVGMVSFVSAAGFVGLADPVASLVVAAAPDVVLAERQPDAWCLGPGLGGDARAEAAVLEALRGPAPVVIDASALDLVSGGAGRTALEHRAAAGATTVLTPHHGEFERLGFDLTGGPLQAARAAARESGCVVVLKGPGTIVAAPDATTFVDTYGTAALATAGTGDVLAGLLAGRLAGAFRGDPRPEARAVAQVAAAAVGLHGLAGRLAAADGAEVTAVSVAAALPAAVALARSARTGAVV